MTTLADRASILSIPQELTEQVLKYCDACDFARIAATCKHLHDIVYNQHDQAVWRILYLSHFDDPRRALGYRHGAETGPSWRRMLQRLTTTEKVLAGSLTTLNAAAGEDRLDDPNEERPIRDALRTLLSAIYSAPPGNSAHNSALTLHKSCGSRT